MTYARNRATNGNNLAAPFGTLESWLIMLSRLLILISLCVVTTYLLYRAADEEQITRKPKFRPGQETRQEIVSLNKISAQQQIKYILFINYKEKDGFSKFSECEYSNCLITANEDFLARKGIDLFDAIVVNVESFKEDDKAMQLMKMFTKRHPNQIYIMKLHESPRPDISMSFVNRQYFTPHFFNWTWSYKQKSDIYDPYGYKFLSKDLQPTKYWKAHHIPVTDVSALPQREMAFWLVSHCETGINREGYVKQLQQYIKVDVFGRCGMGECARKGNECFQNYSLNYMFYIAFENSICDEYATEKFFRALMYPVVPVVMGGADYKAIAPPNSYIDVNDFPSIKALAQYLIKLSKNKELYSAYFKWKESHNAYTWQTFCQLCDTLNGNPAMPRKTIKDAYEWWYLRDNGELTCNTGSDRAYYASIKREKNKLIPKWP